MHVCIHVCMYTALCVCIYMYIFFFLSIIVVGTYHGSQDQPHQVTGNHQQPPQQNTGFPRSSQPYYNSRGVSRGGSRGARGLMNGYRGPANVFRGKKKKPQKTSSCFFLICTIYFYVLHIFLYVMIFRNNVYLH